MNLNILQARRVVWLFLVFFPNSHPRLKESACLTQALDSHNIQDKFDELKKDLSCSAYFNRFFTFKSAIQKVIYKVRGLLTFSS